MATDGRRAPVDECLEANAQKRHKDPGARGSALETSTPPPTGTHYGRFECDTGLAYHNAFAYGRLRIVGDRERKIRFFDELLAKYGTGVPGRPKGFYPRLDDVTVYAFSPRPSRRPRTAP